MTRKVMTADEDTPLEKIATLLERNHIKRVPVLRRGKLVGIASPGESAARACRTRRQGSKSHASNTARIRDDVIAEFRRIGLRTAFVNVVVSDGIVHLWGLDQIGRAA